MKRPTPYEASKAAKLLILEHLANCPAENYAGVLKRCFEGGPGVAVYTVSGRLIDAFDRMLTELDQGWGMSARDAAIDVKPATDGELRELRKIAGLEVK